eukprot:PhM_4_TR11663/c0_g1_i1/m.64044
MPRYTNNSVLPSGAAPRRPALNLPSSSKRSCTPQQKVRSSTPSSSAAGAAATVRSPPIKKAPSLSTPPRSCSSTSGVGVCRRTTLHHFLSLLSGNLSLDEVAMLSNDTFETLCDHIKFFDPLEREDIRVELRRVRGEMGVLSPQRQLLKQPLSSPPPLPLPPLLAQEQQRSATPSASSSSCMTFDLSSSSSALVPCDNYLSGENSNDLLVNLPSIISVTGTNATAVSRFLRFSLHHSIRFVIDEKSKVEQQDDSNDNDVIITALNTHGTVACASTSGRELLFLSIVTKPDTNKKHSFCLATCHALSSMTFVVLDEEEAGDDVDAIFKQDQEGTSSKQLLSTRSLVFVVSPSSSSSSSSSLLLSNMMKQMGSSGNVMIATERSIDMFEALMSRLVQPLVQCNGRVPETFSDVMSCARAWMC